MSNENQNNPIAYVTRFATLSTFHQAVTQERIARQAAASLRSLVKVYLQGRFGKHAPELLTYGFEPNKVPKTPGQISSTSRIGSTLKG